MNATKKAPTQHVYFMSEVCKLIPLFSAPHTISTDHFPHSVLIMSCFHRIVSTLSLYMSLGMLSVQCKKLTTLNMNSVGSGCVKYTHGSCIRESVKEFRHSLPVEKDFGLGLVEKE